MGDDDRPADHSAAERQVDMLVMAQPGERFRYGVVAAKIEGGDQLPPLRFALCGAPESRQRVGVVVESQQGRRRRKRPAVAGPLRKGLVMFVDDPDQDFTFPWPAGRKR